MIYQTKLFSININMYLFHLPFFLIRTDTQGQHMRDYLEKNMVTTTNFIEMTENTPNQGDLLSTKRYIYNTHFRVCRQHERISPQLKKTVGNYYSRENHFPVTESDLGKYEGKLYLPVYKPLKMVGNTANLFNKCIIIDLFIFFVGFQEMPKEVPTLSSSEYGHRLELFADHPDRKHVRIAHVRAEFFRRNGITS